MRTAHFEVDAAARAAALPFFRMYFSLRSLQWPLVGAVAVHALLGWHVLAHWNAAAPGSHTVLAMTLVAPAATARSESPPASETATVIAETPAPTRA